MTQHTSPSAIDLASLKEMSVAELTALAEACREDIGDIVCAFELEGVTMNKWCRLPMFIGAK